MPIDHFVNFCAKNLPAIARRRLAITSMSTRRRRVVVARHVALPFGRYFSNIYSLPYVYCYRSNRCDDGVRFQALLCVTIGHASAISVPYQKCMKSCATKLIICLASLQPFDCYSDELRCRKMCTEKFGQRQKEPKKKKKRHENIKCLRFGKRRNPLDDVK